MSSRSFLRAVLLGARTHHNVRVEAVQALVALGDDVADSVVELAFENKNGRARSGIVQGLAACEAKRIRREVGNMIRSTVLPMARLVARDEERRRGDVGRLRREADLARDRLHRHFAALRSAGDAVVSP